MLSNISADDQHTIALLQATGLFNIISKLELYNGVILAYDHDEDVRLRGVVDRIKTPYLDEDLMVAYECDGTMTLIWKDSVPELFSQGKSVAATSPDDPSLMSISITGISAIASPLNPFNIRHY